jgi:hypothetical protein
MMYYRARYYDPSTGRFLQKDPQPGKLALPASVVNSYSYAGNNPTNLTDATGQFPWGAILGVILIAVAAVAVVAAAMAIAAATTAIGTTVGGAVASALGIAGSTAGGIVGGIAGSLVGGVVGSALGSYAGAIIGGTVGGALNLISGNGTFADGFASGAAAGAAIGAAVGGAIGSYYGGAAGYKAGLIGPAGLPQFAENSRLKCFKRLLDWKNLTAPGMPSTFMGCVFDKMDDVTGAPDTEPSPEPSPSPVPPGAQMISFADPYLRPIGLNPTAHANS